MNERNFCPRSAPFTSSEKCRLELRLVQELCRLSCDSCRRIRDMVDTCAYTALTRRNIRLHGVCTTEHHCHVGVECRLQKLLRHLPLTASRILDTLLGTWGAASAGLRFALTQTVLYWPVNFTVSYFAHGESLWDPKWNTRVIRNLNSVADVAAAPTECQTRLRGRLRFDESTNVRGPDRGSRGVHGPM